MANTSRPWSAALRAVMREPEASAASTTRQPCASPLIKRLRRGKVVGKRCGAEREFADEKPALRDRGHELGVALGIDNVDARAEHSNGGGGARQTAARPRCGDADREPRHDAQSGVAQRLGEALGVMLALRRGVAAA